MHYETDQPRFLIVLGESADLVTDDLEVRILDRVDRVVLVETTYQSSLQLRRSSDVIIHCYEREGDARRVFGLFRH